MKIKNTFNCDVQNFEMYKSDLQNGLFVKPNHEFKIGSLLYLLEWDHEKNVYSGAVIVMKIKSIETSHDNFLFPQLWYLNCEKVSYLNNCFSSTHRIWLSLDLATTFLQHELTKRELIKKN
jgi:hypothetical protein